MSSGKNLNKFYKIWGEINKKNIFYKHRFSSNTTLCEHHSTISVNKIKLFSQCVVTKLLENLVDNVAFLYINVFMLFKFYCNSMAIMFVLLGSVHKCQLTKFRTPKGT